MKLEKTNKFRAIYSTPWTDEAHIYDQPLPGDFYENYPHLFAPLYKFPTGELVAKNDAVWRINSNDVKSVKLSDVHIEGDVEIFPSAESAREAIEKTEKIREKKYKTHSIYDAVEKILLFSKRDVDTSTPAEIKKTLENIRGYAETAFNELKNKE